MQLDRFDLTSLWGKYCLCCHNINQAVRLRCAPDRRPDRANLIIAGAATASQILIQMTMCYDEKLRFALFRHRRRSGSWVKESLDRYGLVIVEGMNDVLHMECLQIAAVSLGSKKITTEQLDKLSRFARQQSSPPAPRLR